MPLTTLTPVRPLPWLRACAGCQLDRCSRSVVFRLLIRDKRRLASEDFGRIEEGRHGFWTTFGPQTRKFLLNGLSHLDQDFTDLTTETMSPMSWIDEPCWLG